MSLTLLRYVLRTYLQYLAAILGGVLVIFLVVDFVDRAKVYTGPGWVGDVLVLYAHKAAITTVQLGPVAMLLAAGASVSALRKRGELTALRSLAVGPASLYGPVGLLALVAALALVVFDERVAVRSGRRVDEITTKRFNARWSDWRRYNRPKQWFRRGQTVFFLRGADGQGGFEDVTILTLTGEFRLERRVDAVRVRHLEGTRWELEDVVERTFGPEGRTSLRTAERATYELAVPPSAFRILPGRPEQMRSEVLRDQIEARGAAGLPTREFRLALHNRFAVPLAGVPAALLAVGLALRPGRKGHLTAAMVEGLVVAVVMWGGMVVGRALVLAERAPAWVAAWAPVAVLALAAGVLWARREGLAGRSGM